MTTPNDGHDASSSVEKKCYPCQERWRHPDEPCWRWWVENYRGELVVHGPGVPPDLRRGAYRASDRLVKCDAF